MIIGKGIYLTIRRPDWFITGKIDSDVLSKNDVDGHNTKSVLANDQNDILIDSNNEEHITDTNVRPLIKSRNDISDSLNGITYDSLFPRSESRILINQNIDGKAHIMRLGKVDTDISIGENAETLKTESPLFTESINDIVTGSNADTFKTSVIKRDSAAAGLFIGGGGTAQKYSYATASVKSGVGIIQAAEANVDVGTTVKSGWYTTQDDISPIETFKIELPLYFVYAGTAYNGDYITYRDIGNNSYKLCLGYYVTGGSRDNSCGGYTYVDGKPRWMMSFLGNSQFSVTQDTQLSQENFEIFSRNFKLIGT